MRNMTILLDANVILDVLQQREIYLNASLRIMEACAEGTLSGYVAFHTVSNLWYILRKEPEAVRRQWLLDLCEITEVCAASHSSVMTAIRNDSFRDFEDCLQDQCAQTVQADYIVTRNLQDYKNGVIPAITPEDLLKKLQK